VGSVLGIPTNSFSILDTLRIQLRGEIDRHRLMKAGLHPTQLAKKRLAELDDMEKKLQAGRH
jgi:hypothetical protein